MTLISPPPLLSNGLKNKHMRRRIHVGVMRSGFKFMRAEIRSDKQVILDD